MYNTDLPSRADLPTSGRLWRSTILAFIAAAVILVSVVLPSEYGIDPTGAGRYLGLTEMGEIKIQLAKEAEADRQTSSEEAIQSAFNLESRLSQSSNAEIENRLAIIEQRLDDIATILSNGVAQPSQTTEKDTQETEQTASVVPEPSPQASEEETAAPVWRDEVSFTLQPGEGIELKLVMQEGAVAEFEWTANGSILNYDTHGDGGGNSVSYEKGRGVPEQAGSLRAAFKGNHGWFWRNRTDQPVTLTLRTRGDYSELKRTV